MLYLICFIVTAVCFGICVNSLIKTKNLKSDYFTPKLGVPIAGVIVTGLLTLMNLTFLIIFGFN